MFGSQAEARRVIIRDPPWFVGDEVAVGEFFWSEEAIDDIRYFGELVQSDESVDLGHEGRQFLTKALGQASGDDDFLAVSFRIRLAVVNGAMDGGDTFFFGVVDERAGVDDEDVSQFRLRGHGHAGQLQVADHDFGVDEVFGATEGNESDFNHGNSWKTPSLAQNTGVSGGKTQTFEVADGGGWGGGWHCADRVGAA